MGVLRLWGIKRLGAKEYFARNGYRFTHVKNRGGEFETVCDHGDLDNVSMCMRYADFMYDPGACTGSTTGVASGC